MKNFIYLLIFCLFSCQSSSHKTNEIAWDTIKIVEYQTLKKNTLGMESSTEWPVLSEEIQQFQGKEIIIEGFYVCVESMNMETLASEQVCLITKQKDPTIEVCGVPQFRQNEFMTIQGPISVSTDKKIKLKGSLEINEDGDLQSLLLLKNAEVVQ